MENNVVIKGELHGLDIIEFKNIHTNWTSQVAYYGNLRTFVSSSQCPDCSLCVSDVMGEMQYKFQILMGISCFALCEGFFASDDRALISLYSLKYNQSFR